MYKILSPTQSILKAYLKDAVAEYDILVFKDAMYNLLRRINSAESEEFNKNLVAEFLNLSLYRDNRYMVNTYQRTDLAIYAEVGTPNEHPVVLFEFKGPSRPDMVSKGDLKKKALYELVLYYIREEKKNKNTDIKHLVITNCWEYFIFEKKTFYQLFAQDNRFVRCVLDADAINNTDYVYNEIIKPKVEQIEHRLQFTYLDLHKFASRITKNTIINDKQFIAAYKLLSPTHLLKLPFNSDHNILNRNFYKELLYIMGVEEVVEDKVHKIKRNNTDQQSYSLVEQAYAKLEDYSSITNDDERFDVALGLVLTWVNRILFLKLLESQLVIFNNDDNVRFLDINCINDYDSLNDLFFKVLAKPIEERSQELKVQFPAVPYLNSSLFEMSKLEERFFAISGIRIGNIEIYNSTILKNERGKRKTGQMNTLDYFFSFLNAYDFGAEHASNKSLTREDSKTLINASVLGLIFEKINGYRNGSFFTPGYITQYMCQKTLRNAIVDKFNKAKKWDCEDFEDLKEKIDYGKREVRNEANEIINSMKICDPAVGSGHFLVSALNELIAIKSELGILQDKKTQPQRIREYEVRVEQDELIISDEDGDYFKYNPSEPTSQRIQEALFEEKRYIIENCLFGVDLNPKSVEICRLRLWIELLKNAYYYKLEDGSRLLQTLPNIDINIKCGDSLVSNHPVCIGRKISNIDGARKLINDYKRYVNEYKRCSSKNVKRAVQNSILRIKQQLQPSIQGNIFGDAFIITQSESSIRKQALEWMIEFPEILDEDGLFEGFDVIIGNPPYISLENIRAESSVYASMRRMDEQGNKIQTYQTYDGRGDIYALFVERGLHLLKKGGHLSYILPNKWQKVMYGRPLRKLFLNKNLHNLIDFGDNQIFGDATTYTCIIQLTNEENRGELHHSMINVVDTETLQEDVENKKEVFNPQLLDDGIWTITDLNTFYTIRRIRQQITSSLETYVGDEEYYGIKTGLSAAFNISIDNANKLVALDESSKDILRPFLQGRGLKSYKNAVPGSYLIYTPKGFTVQGMCIKKETNGLPSEEEAWNWFKDKYPAVAEWLEPHKLKAQKRTDKGDYWWELRACTYYEKFAKPKIFYQVFQTKPCFVYDESSIFCNNSMYFLPITNKALIALLCSRVGWWLISEYCPRIQSGYQLIWDNFKQIPIPHVLPTKLSEYADELMEAVNDNAAFKVLSDKVDQEVCELYGIDLNML